MKFPPTDDFCSSWQAFLLWMVRQDEVLRLHLAKRQFCGLTWPTQRWKWKLWPHKLLGILGRPAHVSKPEVSSLSFQKTTKAQCRLINIFKLLSWDAWLNVSLGPQDTSDPPLAAPSLSALLNPHLFVLMLECPGLTPWFSSFLRIHYLVDLNQSPGFKYHLYVDNLHISVHRRYLSVYTYLHMDV